MNRRTKREIHDVWKDGVIMTRRADLDESCVHSEVIGKKFGGVTLWAANEEQFSSALNALRAGIEYVASMYLTTTKNVLRKKVEEHLKTERIEDRVFSAILGWSLRIGNLDTLICSSINDRPFRVIIHPVQLVRWAGALNLATGMLLKQDILLIRELEAKLFGARAYNTWSSTAHVLSYLNYKGTVKQLDEFSFQSVKDFR